jgi:hypothetical protein
VKWIGFAGQAVSVGGWPTFASWQRWELTLAASEIFILASPHCLRMRPLLRKQNSDSCSTATVPDEMQVVRAVIAPGMVTKPDYSYQQGKAVTADLAVPTFTKNVKVGQPPGLASGLFYSLYLLRQRLEFF